MRKTHLWFLQLISGALIAVLLGIHMGLMHLDDILIILGIDAVEPTSWDSMISRAMQVTWVALYIALLIVALYHALYGLRGVIIELTSSAAAKRAVTWIIIAFGLTAFIAGTYVPIALLSS